MGAARLAVLIAALALSGASLAVAPIGAPTWRELSAAQREVLEPLSGEWNAMGEEHRQKWIGIANRYERLTPAEQTRMRERMKRWADLQPEERERARDQYRALRNTSPDKREAMSEQWQRYRSLPPDERKLKQDSKAGRPSTLLPARESRND